MKKLRSKEILRRQLGFTLLEVMVSTALVGVIFVALMTLLGKSGEVSAIFRGQVRTIEGVSEAVGALNSILPQVTRIQTCKCRANSSTRANCIWDSSSTNAWYDPVRDGSLSGTPPVILSGEFEAYDGTQALNSMAGLASPASFMGVPCIGQASNLSTSLQRGCRQSFSLEFTAPTQAAVGTPSKAGMLRLRIGGRGDAQSYTIGADTEDGAGGLGVTELACGFDSSSGGVTGSNFVLNLRVKTKLNTIRDPSHANYESWYPGRTTAAQSVQATKNYLRGQFREIRMKFGMRNLTSRGIYAWKALSIRDCKQNGESAGNVAQCCSQAFDGATCVPCVRSGQGGSSNIICCSGTRTGGTCN